MWQSLLKPSHNKASTFSKSFSQLPAVSAAGIHFKFQLLMITAKTMYFNRIVNLVDEGFLIAKFSASSSLNYAKMINPRTKSIIYVYHDLRTRSVYQRRDGKCQYMFKEADSVH